MVNLGKVSFTANQTEQARANPAPQVGFPQNAQQVQQPQPRANPAPVVQQQPKINIPTREDLQKHLDLVNKAVGGLNVDLSFQVLESTGNLFVQVKDNNTGKTIKVMPAVQFLKYKDNIAHQIKGFLENRLA